METSSTQVEKLRGQVSEQEASLEAQEEEVFGRKRLLDELRLEETSLEAEMGTVEKSLQAVEAHCEKTEDTLMEVMLINNMAIHANP